MRRPRSTHPALMRLEEEVICVWVCHTAIDHQSAGQVARRIDISGTAEEPGAVSSGTDADQNSRSIPRDEAMASGQNSIVLISHLCRVLPFGDAVAEYQNPIGELLVRLEEDLQVFLDHSGQVFDNIVSALLEPDLGRKEGAIGIVGRNRARDGRRPIVPRSDPRLLFSSTSSTVQRGS